MIDLITRDELKVYLKKDKIDETEDELYDFLITGASVDIQNRLIQAELTAADLSEDLTMAMGIYIQSIINKMGKENLISQNSAGNSFQFSEAEIPKPAREIFLSYKTPITQLDVSEINPQINDYADYL